MWHVQREILKWKLKVKYFLKSQRVIEEETQQKPLVSICTSLMTRVVSIGSCLHEIIPLMGRNIRSNYLFNSHTSLFILRNKLTLSVSLPDLVTSTR